MCLQAAQRARDDGEDDQYYSLKRKLKRLQTLTEAAAVHQEPLRLQPALQEWTVVDGVRQKHTLETMVATAANSVGGILSIVATCVALWILTRIPVQLTRALTRVVVVGRCFLSTLRTGHWSRRSRQSQNMKKTLSLSHFFRSSNDKVHEETAPVLYPPELR